MRLVIDMVVALVASLIVASIAVMVVIQEHFEDSSVALGMLAAWVTPFLALPLMAFAASRQNGRRAIMRLLRVLIGLPILLVVVLRLCDFAGVRPAWSRPITSEAELTVLAGIVAAVAMQGIILIARAGGSSQVSEQRSPRFGRSAKDRDAT